MGKAQSPSWNIYMCPTTYMLAREKLLTFICMMFKLFCWTVQYVLSVIDRNAHSMVGFVPIMLLASWKIVDFSWLVHVCVLRKIWSSWWGSTAILLTGKSRQKNVYLFHNAVIEILRPRADAGTANLRWMEQGRVYRTGFRLSCHFAATCVQGRSFCA